MDTVHALDVIEDRIRQEITKLQARLPHQTPPAGVLKRGSDASFDDGFAVERKQISGLQDVLDMLGRSEHTRKLLGDLIGQYLIETEQRLVQQIEQQTREMVQREQVRDRQQRRENGVISIVSLVVGWLLSIISNPVTLFAHLWH